ncbi:pteridine reductase [Saccharospirillum sp. MSK14-1]|uniref:pteridine reductase n=1 Tax=Saccharospirillum sp. MSK14-1 TaxID=1897632 RepID=UPI000D36F3B3|nr:pteridine reductase [Saccharospirillum sp. MSK14-1]PTY35803.1 pteridine reductase [Saccharospirillum sp. MSK14-1]
MELTLNLTPTDPAPVVVITGAARRVGAQMARTFHNAGFRVVIHYRSSQSDAETLAAELNQQRSNSAQSLHSTLDDADTIAQFAEKASGAFGRIDVLINSASAFFPTAFGDIKEDDLDLLLHTNLRLPLLLTQALAPALRHTNGAVINMVDIHALRPLANHPAYTAAKAGLISATKSMALDLAPNVRANAVAPGAILLPESQGSDYEKELTDQIPLARMGHPTDLAQAALFLATAPYITGQVLAVDGGRTLKQ